MTPRLPYELVSAPPGSAADHRQRVEQATREHAAQRDRELESQTSSVKEPRERIEIWERLHALRLPRSPQHVLVKVIARQTRLTVGQVHEEQMRRAGTLPAPVHQPSLQQHDAEDDRVPKTGRSPDLIVDPASI